jgi:hypothetical protein
MAWSRVMGVGAAAAGRALRAARKVRTGSRIVDVWRVKEKMLSSQKNANAF